MNAFVGVYGKRATLHIERFHDSEPRALLLAGIEVLLTMPWVLAWIVAVLSFVRHPGIRRWTLPGAIIGASAAYAVFTILSIPLVPDMVVLAAHLGFGLGYFLCSRLDHTVLDNGDIAPAQAIIQKVDEESTKVEASSTTTTTSTGSEVKDASLATGFMMLWFAAAVCRNTVEDLIPDLSNLAGESSVIPVMMSIVALLITIVSYTFMAMCYLRNTRNALWDCACGLVIGSVTWILLLYTALESTWESWIIDGTLAFVGVNAGILIGLCWRYRCMPWG